MTTAIVSCLQLLEDGKCVEVAVVGNEGFIGVSLFMGGGPAQGRAVVQRKGHALRISAALLLEEFNRAGALMQVEDQTVQLNPTRAAPGESRSGCSGCRRINNVSTTRPSRSVITQPASIIS